MESSVMAKMASILTLFHSPVLLVHQPVHTFLFSAVRNLRILKSEQVKVKPTWYPADPVDMSPGLTEVHGINNEAVTVNI